jgi:ribonuclease P protein component
MPVPPDNAQPELGSIRLPTDERFPRSARLLRRSEFLRVQNSGRRVHTAHFIILLSQGQGSRLGVTVGRRVGCAVRRNRIKRVVREVFRRNRELFPADCDVVLVARSGAERLDYGSVKDELTRAQAALARLQKQLPTLPKPKSDP